MDNGEKTKLLLVDDKLENLQALEALIGRADVEIHSALSGEAALELLLCHEFALAIVDVQMPGMDGFELAELMRGMERVKQVPIVFVSAIGKETNYAFKGYESGAVDFLHKPLDVHAVRSKVNVFFDLYQQKRTLREQLMALQKIQLEQELLLAELQKTQTELQMAVRVRDEFLSIAAHELRTPLSVLKLQIQMRERSLKRGDMSAFSPEMIERSVQQDRRLVEILFRQINEMVDIARIRAGKLYLSPSRFDLGEMVREIVEQFADQFAASGCEVRLEADEALLGKWDRFRLEQVLINLLTNAMRYAQGKPVHVSVRRRGSRAGFSVADAGPGIDAADQERIFQQFERAVPALQGAGLGLGLYIARKIVEGHGGTIRVQSRPGAGATFTVELPIEAAEQAEALPAPDETRSAG
ncbi:hybrid sensor histidine kinase/response regulator [Chitinimonas koreensis]|uniref:hybrid sensor histidine kinase/response regulator n=1 Tax=Chitinimonas koreensis TaxID=356302 RepID=UPI00040F920E|nr:hybrid sensor histidine kinase/response regulator [Chitinimonas koreensis]QNM94785.1 hybrid sensor histidine kinase/response regulator [Chitinimonas koreensis]